MGIRQIDDYLGKPMSPEILDSNGHPATIIRSWDFTEVCRPGNSGVVANYALAAGKLHTQVHDESSGKKGHWQLSDVTKDDLVRAKGFREMSRRVDLDPCVLARMLMAHQPQISAGKMVPRRG